MLQNTGHQGDKTVLVDFAEKAEWARASVEHIRAEVAGLAKGEFLMMDADLDRLARVWVNPAVAFLP